MIGGQPVRYADFGKGEKVLLLLHGYLESMEVWENFASELSREYRILTLDLPGHGFSGYSIPSDGDAAGAITMESMAATVLGVMDRAGIDRCTVIGHSMGGYVALAMAAAAPERLDALVLFHSSPNADSPEKAEFRLREIHVIEAGKKEMLAHVNPGRGFSPDNLRRCANAIDELSEQIMLTDDDAIIATLKGMGKRKDQNQMMNALAIPQLMIFGHHDSYITAESAQIMIEAHPTAKVAWLERSGHMGFIEECPASLAIIREFVG